MTIYEFPPELAFQRLRELRILLLRLHKALLESERTTYEQVHGRIANNGEFFQLVIGHEWFDWLRPMSQFIAQIDEAVSAKQPMTLGDANALLANAQSLLTPAEQGPPAAQRYYQAIQRDPDIAFMHAEVSSLFRP
jgi:hypothetical protein